VRRDGRLCDVDRRTLTADPADVERRITPRTRAICVVHMWGNPAPLDRFTQLARRHGVALIEDCSHAHGASYLGRPVGGWGDIGCFSLQGAKAVSGGEAGIAVTDDPELFDRMLLLGHYGRLKNGQANDTFDTDHLSLGLKYRPHLYAVLLAQGSLSRLDELNRRRRHNYAILTEELDGCRAVQPIPTTPGAVRGGFLEYILRYDPEHVDGLRRTSSSRPRRQKACRSRRSATRPSAGGRACCTSRPSSPPRTSTHSATARPRALGRESKVRCRSPKRSEAGS
jgi:perosamine synthetase